jgi:transposase
MRRQNGYLCAHRLDDVIWQAVRILDEFHFEGLAVHRKALTKLRCQKRWLVVSTTER